MSLPQPPTTDSTIVETNPQRNKLLLLLVLAVAILAIGIFAFLLWRAGRLPFLHQKPQSLSSELSLTEQQPLPIRSLGEGYGYRLTCQIFQKDIIYTEEWLGDYLIQATIPCWFYNREGKITSIVIPLLIENAGQSTFVEVDGNTVGQINTPIQGQIKINMVEGIFQSRLEEKTYAILVDIGFGATQFMSYPDENPDSAVFFLRPLAESMQQQAAIERFVQTDQWPKDQGYLFYQYSQVRPLQ